MTHEEPGQVEVVDYTPELYGDVCDNMLDYFQTGWTVCGAEDPAVISLGEEFGEKHPELAGYTTVRVIDRYVSPWKSDTLLEFSNSDITDEEYKLYEELVDEDGSPN